MILLQMIRNNYTNDAKLKLYPQDKTCEDYIGYARGLINHYTSLFCRLAKLKPVKLETEFIKTGTSIGINSNNGIYIKNNNKPGIIAREIWYGTKINYRIKKEDLPDLEYILNEAFSLECFKEGQFQALCAVLSSTNHMVCIMPTGSGKSLIYYLASLLQPLPLFIIVPTEILIKDQIRMLETVHRIDNAAHLLLTPNNDFNDFFIRNSLNYLTPDTLRNKHLFDKLKRISNGLSFNSTSEFRLANGSLIAYIVLDEIHCISNWGHDFRPDYYMLPRTLTMYLNKIIFLGFTATADYTVAEDIRHQLSIQAENFISPLLFERYNINYDYRCLETIEDMYDTVSDIANELCGKNERTIIFTKNDEISKRVADIIGYQADCFTSDNNEAYHTFVSGKSNVLVTCEDLGIGINMPNINNTIHFGLPLSKSQYVQEIGRAGRANESVTSYILYLNPGNNAHHTLLKRNVPINDIRPMINGVINDYTDIYNKITGDFHSKETLFSELIDMYRKYNEQYKSIMTCSIEEAKRVKKLLCILYTTGFIQDWFSYDAKTADNVKKSNIHGNIVNIMIIGRATNTDGGYIGSHLMAHRMKKHFRDYLAHIKNSREVIFKVDRAETAEDIIRIYIDWYYDNYLYSHYEQFIDLYDLINRNINYDNKKRNEQIADEIKSYFTLPFVKLSNIEETYSGMSVSAIINKALTGISQETFANVERINSSRYSVSLDLLLFSCRLRMSNIFEDDRLSRILNAIKEQEYNDITNGLIKLYCVCDINGRLSIINYIGSSKNKLQIDVSSFAEAAYSNMRKDLVYYAIYARRINALLCPAV